MTLDTPLFAQHARRWQDNTYVYPVISRRSRGLSVGINLNPDGVCNFDCAYCCVDRRTPATVRTVDLDQVRQELDHILGLIVADQIFAQAPLDATPAALRRFNDVAFSGDGEPTSYPQFGAACQLVMELLAWHGLDAKVVVITNATLLQQERVQAAFDLLGERGEIWAKLDAGTEEYYRVVDRSAIPFSRILANLLAAGRRRPLVIQTLFARLHGEAPPAAEITAWIGRLTTLRAEGASLDRIQVYTTARSTTESWVEPLTRPEVDAIVAQANAAGFTAEAYYGPA